MNLTKPAIGIDVSLLKLDATLLVQGKVKSISVDNSAAGYAQLRDWLAERHVEIDGLQACMESGGPHNEAAALALAALGMVVSVVDPAQVKLFAHNELQRSRRDQLDAVKLARFCAVMHPEPWAPPGAAEHERRAWSERLHALRQIEHQEQQQLETYRLVGKQALGDDVQQHLDWLERQIERLEAQLAEPAARTLVRRGRHQGVRPHGV